MNRLRARVAPTTLRNRLLRNLNAEHRKFLGAPIKHAEAFNAILRRSQALPPSQRNAVVARANGLRDELQRWWAAKQQPRPTPPPRTPESRMPSPPRSRPRNTRIAAKETLNNKLVHLAMLTQAAQTARMLRQAPTPPRRR